MVLAYFLLIFALFALVASWVNLAMDQRFHRQMARRGKRDQRQRKAVNESWEQAQREAERIFLLPPGEHPTRIAPDVQKALNDIHRRVRQELAEDEKAERAVAEAALEAARRRQMLDEYSDKKLVHKALNSPPDSRLRSPRRKRDRIGGASSENGRSRSRRIPASVKRAVFERDEGKCVACGSDEDIHFDHDIPFSKGGGNHVENVQILCEQCNLRKGDKIE